MTDIANDTRMRSVAKGVVWRVLATMTTIALVYIAFGKLGRATAVGAAEVVVKLLLYYGHERIWNTIGWGRTTALPDMDTTAVSNTTVIPNTTTID